MQEFRMVGASSGSSSLKEYLKRYENNNEEEKKKKKKKKKAKPDVSGRGVIVVDEDPIPVKLEEEEEDHSVDEEKPMVDEDIEVKRMKRLEQLRARRPFGAISEDGSGWVSVSETPSIMSTDDQKSDMSPPRKRRVRNDTPSPGPEEKPSSMEDLDLSPPRKRQENYSSPRPEREGRKSEPLSCKVSDSADQSDMSPPRRRRTRYDLPSPETDFRTSEPGREVLDLSPPRRQNRHDSRATPAGDLSPPRKSRKDESMSGLPLRQSSQRSGRSSVAPESSVADLSPPRKRRKESPVLVARPKTGLVTGKDIKEEIAKKKEEDWLRFKEMDPSVSGRGAEPVYRDKITGERLSKEQLLKLQKKEEPKKEIKLEWGKGLAQKREAEARLQELELEKDKPFARSRDDPDLDKMLKERVRWGDPMAHLVKKKHLEPVLPDLGHSEKMKESGFIIPQEIPSHSWIKRGLDAAPNRYGIRPGRHWDGVDRSNGFEKKMFKRMNEKQATEREAYLWSVSDM